jgi:putative DNA methylase
MRLRARQRARRVVKVSENHKRLIEDYLPVRELNEIAAKEKKHPEHPVALIHYWPARRPITACRAAIYAALVAAPKTSEDRELAARFVTNLANFKVSPDVIAKASDQIKAQHGGCSPKVLDIFSGGGAIPLEAARLGCDSHAIEYNPVAHLVELCTLVFPQRFGSTLADDVGTWGKRIINRLRDKVADWYPQVRLDDSKAISQQLSMFGAAGESAGVGHNPVAYIWVRTVPCRNPQCRSTVPLVRQAWLRKKGGVVSAVPKLKKDGATLVWEIVVGANAPDDDDEQTGAGGAVCLACPTPVPASYVKECGIAGKIGESLAALVLLGPKSKVYVPGQQPVGEITPDVEAIARSLGLELPTEELKGKLRDQLPSYGFQTHKDLYTTRQLGVLITLAGLIRQAHAEMLGGGLEAQRATAVTTFLAMGFGRLTNSFTKFCRWQGQDQKTIAAIGDRQALKMVYDFSEINPFAETAGCLPFAFDNEVHCIRSLAAVGRPATVTRCSAEELPYQDEMFDAVITDPPYYSSIFYSDLSSFFYVWLRRILGDLYPEHFVLPSPPKRREAVAQASEYKGDEEQANNHYEQVMARAFAEARRVLKPNAPFVCVYAHKTTAGWASLIRVLVPAGLTVTEAWPIQTEARGRTNAIGAAALSDSIFLVARRRGLDTTGQYESTVQPELLQIAGERVATLWDLGFAGADLVIASVGAGLRAFTRHARVEYANGEIVPAERFLAEVEAVVLDTVLYRLSKAVGAGNAQHSLAGVDPATRFYILWRYTYKSAELDAGEAFIFANGTHVELDGVRGLSSGSRQLVEKKKTKYRLLDYSERGDDAKLGSAREDGQSAPLIDALHRLLWLMERHPSGISEFLRETRPNIEQIRLVAQALVGPALKGGELGEVASGTELAALTRLTANWRSVVEDSGVGPLFQAVDSMTK